MATTDELMAFVVMTVMALALAWYVRCSDSLKATGENRGADRLVTEHRLIGSLKERAGPMGHQPSPDNRVSGDGPQRGLEDNVCRAGCVPVFAIYRPNVVA